ncbi:hypothetical protein INR49_026923 [Caranx melampygus]|nr:hypothetical protein INR49_026923 [Caranx melampygus]
MDPSRLLLLLLISVMSGFECSETARECTDIQERARHRPDGEALHVMFVFQELDQFPHEQFKWYKKNSTNSTPISPNKTERVHYHAGELFFLNLLPEDSGSYTAQHIDESGQCFNYNVDIDVYNASDRWNPAYFHGTRKSSDDCIKIVCPDPVVETCSKFKGNYTWYKNFTFSSISTNKKEIWVKQASQDVRGLYTCICTWPYNNNMYNSSASRMLEVEEITQKHCEILSPINTEQFADEGAGIRLNCSVFCGIRAERHCNASWLLDPGMTDGYNKITEVTTDRHTSKTIATTVLIIDKVSPADFQRKFKCSGSCFFKSMAATLTLKQRESRTPLIVAPICVLLICAFAAVLVKCFAIDLALLFRRYVPLNSKRKDRVELVEDSIKQSRRLMVILTPGSGPEPDQCPASTQESAIGGFDWQVGLHHALVQREMSVILIQIGDTGPQGYTHLPIGLQHLIRKSAPVKWPDGSWGAASWNSRFWKRVRYLMPATPAKKCLHSAIV